MSSKKPVPEISQAEVESEIAALAGESHAPTTSKTLTPTENHQIKEVVTGMTQVRDENNPLVKSIMTAVQNALSSSASSQQTRKPAPISRQVPASFQAQDLFSPSELEAEVDGDSENVEEEVLSDDEQEFEFDNIPPSGMQTKNKAESPKTLDEDLFNMYGLTENWKLAPEVIPWFQSIVDKEVPAPILKEINEAFVPSDTLQPLFTAPALPLAINKKLFTAPKSLSRGPKMINFSLHRAQKELCVAYKPLIESLNFFYSETFIFLIETVPGCKAELIRQKTLLSQTLAIIISASLKVSSARKDALRPLLKFSSTGILGHNPTSEHVLGSADLASLSEQATKEYRALSGVFRNASENRARYRPSGRGFNRFLNYRGSNPHYGYQGYTRYPKNQDDQNYRRPRSRPKNRRGRPSSTK